MKTPQSTLVMPVLMAFAVLCISWSLFSPANKKTLFNPVSHLLNYSNALYPFANQEIYDPENITVAIRAGDIESVKVPGAADILVQKIEGDNNHILMIAMYYKELFNEKYITVNNDGDTISFRDDGKGYDKKAGDGLFTARIKINVPELNKMALTINNQTSFRKQKPLRFKGREIVLNEIDSVCDHFNIKKFNENKPVSIAGIALNEPPNELITHCLTITSLSVVEDPVRTWNSCTQTGNVDGPWTFKTLMKHMASTDPANLATDAQVSTFVLNWLNTWKTVQSINSENIAARTKVANKIITTWLDNSLAAGAPSGQLDMKFAPFKLTAIVNRLDLRTDVGFGNTNAGEGRFVFCLIKSDCTQKEEFTVIFEYGVPKTGCADVFAYADQWYNLKELEPGTVPFNIALQDITDQFAKCGTSPAKPNQNSLNQLRTNEVTISNTPQIWELREFIIDNSTNQLKPVTVKKEPAEKYNAKADNADVERLVRFVNANAPDINSGNYTVPDLFESTPFLGGAAHTQSPPVGGADSVVHHWDGTDHTFPLSFITNDDARQSFSLNTCSGCHGGEAQTFFTHVDPVFFGTEATLSGFLTGKAGRLGSVDFDNDSTNGIMLVRDASGRPSGSPAYRGFNDLARRAIDLENLVSAPCGSFLKLRDMLMFQPLNMTH